MRISYQNHGIFSNEKAGHGSIRKIHARLCRVLLASSPECHDHASDGDKEEDSGGDSPESLEFLAFLFCLWEWRGLASPVKKPSLELLRNQPIRAQLGIDQVARRLSFVVHSSLLFRCHAGICSSKARMAVRIGVGKNTASSPHHCRLTRPLLWRLPRSLRMASCEGFLPMKLRSLGRS